MHLKWIGVVEQGRTQGLEIENVYWQKDVPDAAIEFERKTFLPTHGLDNTSAAACVNTVLTYLRRYLLLQRGIIEFNKCRLVVDNSMTSNR